MTTYRRNILLGLGVLVITAATLVFAYKAQDGLPWRDAYTVRVTLPDAANLARHDVVRMGGRRIGQIADLEVTRGRAELTLDLDGSVAPLAADTTARPRARSALGQHFLELTAGRSSATVGDGGAIRAGDEASVVQLDQVLSTFDPATRARTRELLGQLGAGAGNRGSDMATVLGGAPGLLADTTTVARALNGPDEPVGALIHGADAAVAAAAPRAWHLAAGYLPEARALAAIPDERRAVSAALAAAPGTLRTLTRELAPATRLIGALGRLATGSRPLLEAAPRSFGEAARLLPDAGPGLASLEPVFDRLERAAAPSLRLLRGLRRLGPAAVAALRDGATALGDLAARPCQLRRWLRNWGGPDGIMSSRTAAGGFIRFTLIGAEAPLAGARTPPGSASKPYPAPSDCSEAQR
jgi:phospholipid/cholesterol/gamma-HCH transport system substrate-binding protein